MKTQRPNQKRNHKKLAVLCSIVAVIGIPVTLTTAKPPDGKGKPGGQFTTQLYDVEIIEDTGPDVLWGTPASGTPGDDRRGRIETDEGVLRINHIFGSEFATIHMGHLREYAQPIPANPTSCCEPDNPLADGGKDWEKCFDLNDLDVDSDNLNGGTVSIAGDVTGNDFVKVIHGLRRLGNKAEDYRLVVEGSAWMQPDMDGDPIVNPLALPDGGTAEMTLSCWTLKASKKPKVANGCTGCGDFRAFEGNPSTVTVKITHLPQE